MERNIIARTIIILTFIGFIFCAIFLCFIPKKLYKVGGKYPRIEIVLSEKPYFHYIGLNQPFYYNLETKNYPNSFRIADFVLDLTQANDSISTAIKKLNRGDTIIIAIDSLSFHQLNRNSDNIEILGLAFKNNVIIDTDKIEKYQTKSNADKNFTFIVIGIIFFFIVRRHINSNRKSENNAKP